MLFTQFGVQLYPMCVQPIVEVIQVDVASVGKVDHESVNLAQRVALRNKRIRVRP